MAYTPTLIDYEGSDADRLPDLGLKVNTNFQDIEDEFNAWMGSGVCGSFPYVATGFVGGTAGMLDNIDATDIADGEKAIVVLGDSTPRLYFYRMKSPDTTTESSPKVIQPDTGGTSKRWMLAGRSENEPHMGSAAPTANDDVNDGFRIGDMWHYDDTFYFCLDNTVASAEWIAIPAASTLPAHASSHEDGGSDEISLLKDDIQIAGAADLLEITKPSDPGSGRDKLYFKSGGGLYKLDNSSSEKELVDEDILDTSTGHDHNGANSKTIAHSDTSGRTVNDHHNQTHTWEGGDHSGTLNESSVTFTNSGGHDHDGTGSTVIDHSDLGNVTTDQHHPQAHAATHIDGGADELDGDTLVITWAGYANYSPSTIPSEVDTTDDLTAHLAGIDAAIGAAGGTLTDVVGGKLIRDSATSLKWAFISSNQVFLFNDTAPVVCLLLSEPTLANTANDLDSTPLAVDSNYDIFLEYSSATAANLVAKKWTDATTRAVTPEMYKGQPVYDADTAAGRKRRFVGTIRMINDTGAKFADDGEQRFISNLYHVERKPLEFPNPYSSSTSDTGVGTSWERFNPPDTTYNWYVEFVYHGLNAAGLDVKQHTIEMRADVIAYSDETATTDDGFVGIGYSTSTAEVDHVSTFAEYLSPQMSVKMVAEPSTGYRTLYPLQKTDVTISGFKFHDGTSPSAHFIGWIEA